jgi:hypothetical protein
MLIQKGKAKFIENQSNRIAIFEVLIDGIVLYPVYDRVRKLIVTFLTKEMINDRKLGE